MSSETVQTSEGLIYRCPTKVDLPEEDILTFLFDSASSQHPDDLVLHADAEDPTQCLTKSQQVSLFQRVASTLRQRYGIGGNGPNQDVVLTLCLGHWTLPTIAYGTIAAGGILSASSPASTAADVVYHMTLTKPKVLICSEQLKPVALAAAEKIGMPAKQVLVLCSDAREFMLKEAASGQRVALSSDELQWERIKDTKTLASRIACVLFSSGTTGLPKGVCLSQRNIVSESFLCQASLIEWWRRLDPTKKHRTLAHLPAAHIAGAQGYFFNTPYLGATVYWMSRFDLEKFATLNRRLEITSFFSVPPIYLAISQSPNIRGDDFRALESASAGAAPMSKELQAQAQNKMGPGSLRLAQTWGLSETTGAFTMLPRNETDDTGSVGSLLPHCEARIVDDDGRDVTPGEPGETWIRGPVVSPGYWENPKANAESFRDGWFRTGDVLSCRNGRFYVVDRKKELIKYKGTQVAPAELEALLLTHPSVRDAAVIGVAGDGTEVPRAFVVPAEKDQITPEKIQEWVAAQVAGHKRLRGGVVFVEAVPKSPSGKILRNILRDKAKQEQKAKI